MHWRCCCRLAIGCARSGQWAAASTLGGEPRRSSTARLRASPELPPKAAAAASSAHTLLQDGGDQTPPPSSAQLPCDGRKRTLADMSFAVAIWSSRLAVVVAMASRDGWASTRTQRLMSCLHPANQHRPCQWRPSAPDAPMMLPSTLPARHAVQRESSNAWALACDGRRQVSAGPPSMHDRFRKAP